MIINNSGFLVTRDGFGFENFSTKVASGHCYGMAAFAMLYYTKELPLSLGALDNTRFYQPQFKLVSSGYNLENTYFAKHNNLYDFTFTNEALKMEFYEIPDDFRDRVIDDTFMIKKEYVEALESIGADIVIKDLRHSACKNIGVSEVMIFIRKD